MAAAVAHLYKLEAELRDAMAAITAHNDSHGEDADQRRGKRERLERGEEHLRASRDRLSDAYQALDFWWECEIGIEDEQRASGAAA